MQLFLSVARKGGEGMRPWGGSWSIGTWVQYNYMTKRKGFDRSIGQIVEWLSLVHQGHWMSNINQFLASLFISGLIFATAISKSLHFCFPAVRFPEISREKNCGSGQNFTTITHLQKRNIRKSSTLEIRHWNKTDLNTNQGNWIITSTEPPRKSDIRTVEVSWQKSASRIQW